MHKVSLKSGLAIAILAFGVAAHAATVTLHNGTSTITSTQSGGGSEATQSVEQTPDGTTLHQSDGGNSFDFTQNGKPVSPSTGGTAIDPDTSGPADAASEDRTERTDR